MLCNVHDNKTVAGNDAHISRAGSNFCASYLLREAVVHHFVYQDEAEGDLPSSHHLARVVVLRLGVLCLVVINGVSNEVNIGQAVILNGDGGKGTIELTVDIE